MSYFVKLLGSGKMPMSNTPWDRDDEMNIEVRFPDKLDVHNVTRGDELIYYAVGGQKRIFGSVRLDEDPLLNPHHSNPLIAKLWPYAAKVTIRPDVKLHYVSSGPSLNDITPGLQSEIHEGVSHFEIGLPQFERAVSLLRQAKHAEDSERRRKGEIT